MKPNWHTEKATQLLREHREEHADPDSPVVCKCQCSKFPKDGSFTYKEINYIMGRIVDENGSVELVKALLDLGGDVNHIRRSSSSLWKKVARRNQQPERSDVLQIATVRCGPTLVEALAAKADQENLDNALHYGLLRRDLDIVGVLLKHGADPAPLHEDFEKAMICSETDIIRLLVSGPKRPCVDCLSVSLTMAVQNSATEILRLLVAAGADPDYGLGAAMAMAVGANKIDYLRILISGPTRASEASLDIALGVAHQNLWDSDDATQRQMIDICLRAGARGERTERLFTSGLVNSVKKRQSRLLELILQNARPADPFHTLAVLEAIKGNQTVTLARLLRLSPSQGCMVTATAQAMKIKDSEVMYETVALLLSMGVRGRPVGDAFVQCVRLLSRGQASPGGPDPFHRELGKLLLGAGDADINQSQGEALRIAIVSNLRQVVCAIMDKRPALPTLEAALPAAMRVRDATYKMEVVQMLLLGGLEGPVVDKTLVDAVNAAPRNTPLVELLLTVASVDHNTGEALVGCIRNQDLDLLRLILAKRPGRQAVSSAARTAMDLGTVDRRTTIGELIGNFETEHLNFCLVQAIGMPKRDMTLVGMLLDAGARPEHDGGVCIKLAVMTSDIILLRLLAAKTGANEKVYTDALAQLISTDHSWMSQSRVEIVELLLKHGASGHVVNRALLDVVQAMLPSRSPKMPASPRTPRSPMRPMSPMSSMSSMNPVHPTTPKKPLRSMSPMSSMSPVHPTSPRSPASIRSASSQSCNLPADSLLDLLLAHGADVNFEGGKPAQLVARSGDRHSLRKFLAQRGASQRTATAALYAAITAGHSEARLLELIDVLSDHKAAASPDFSAAPADGMMPPVFLCLAAYPRSTMVINRLISAGCSLDQTVAQIVYGPLSDSGRDTPPFGQEPVNALIWALLQPSHRISSAVITELAEQGGNVKFTTTRSRVTPLLLAANTGRPGLVDKFIRLGASASEQDAFGRSALFYASRIGNHESVVLLLKQKVPADDGSLHEAARNFQVDVMEKLIAAGHDPNFRSCQHHGHTALTEMASKGSVPEDLDAAEAAVDLLRRAGADPLLQVGGKTAVFWALENNSGSRRSSRASGGSQSVGGGGGCSGAEAITKVLLEGILYKTLGDERNVFRDAAVDGFFYYSPTMYLSKGRSNATPEVAQALLALLRTHAAVDRFYAGADADEQPPDAVGMPEEIREVERERRARRLRQQRAEEEAAAAEAEAATGVYEVRRRSDNNDCAGSARSGPRGRDAERGESGGSLRHAQPAARLRAEEQALEAWRREMEGRGTTPPVGQQQWTPQMVREDGSGGGGVGGGGRRADWVAQSPAVAMVSTWANGDQPQSPQQQQQRQLQKPPPPPQPKTKKHSSDKSSRPGSTGGKSSKSSKSSKSTASGARASARKPSSTTAREGSSRRVAAR
ncbi:hypothetical protein RB600_004394 [Gaeumannomyces tritici]